MIKHILQNDSCSFKILYSSINGKKTLTIRHRLQAELIHTGKSIYSPSPFVCKLAVFFSLLVFQQMLILVLRADKSMKNVCSRRY